MFADGMSVYVSNWALHQLVFCVIAGLWHSCLWHAPPLCVCCRSRGHHIWSFGGIHIYHKIKVYNWLFSPPSFIQILGVLLALFLCCSMHCMQINYQHNNHLRMRNASSKLCWVELLRVKMGERSELSCCANFTRVLLVIINIFFGVSKEICSS